MTARVVCVVAYTLSWLVFLTGVILYYPIFIHLQRLHIMDTAGAMILMPILSFLVPGLGIGILLVSHIISNRHNRRQTYMALITFLSVPYLTGGGVTIFMAAGFLGTIQKGSTRANGVPIQWVSLVLFSCLVSITVYWISVVLVTLAHFKPSPYRSQELIRTSEYEPLQ
jgi:hypothetical protein